MKRVGIFIYLLLFCGLPTLSQEDKAFHLQSGIKIPPPHKYQYFDLKNIQDGKFANFKTAFMKKVLNQDLEMLAFIPQQTEGMAAAVQYPSMTGQKISKEKFALICTVFKTAFADQGYIKERTEKLNKARKEAQAESKLQTANRELKKMEIEVISEEEDLMALHFLHSSQVENTEETDDKNFVIGIMNLNGEFLMVILGQEGGDIESLTMDWIERIKETNPPSASPEDSPAEEVSNDTSNS